MKSNVAEALEALRALGSPDEMRGKAEQGIAPATRPKVNAHIHLPPNFSAFDTVEQAVELAAEQGVGVLGVSNYYDYTVYGDFVQLARAKGIFPLFGLEIICMLDDLRDAGVKINDPGNPGKMYICGKGITRFANRDDDADDYALTVEGERLLNIIRRNDARRMADMAAKMAEVFRKRGLPTGIDHDAVKDMVTIRHGSPREHVHLQERHLAQCFQEKLFDNVAPDSRLATLSQLLDAETKATDADDHVTIQGDIRSHLMKAGKVAFVDESFVSFDQAKTLILEMGGIPSYPTLADGTSPTCPFEETPATLIENITSRGLHAAEFIPIRNKADVLSEYVKAMRSAGLVVTAGTEHNTLDLIPIEPTCVGGQAIPDDIKAIFWEGACVVAAHQFLSLHGEVGFVDREGEPNAGYDSADDRIQAFASLGAAVIQTYDESNG